jgi:uncharacterized DUF497 family protein
MGNHMSGIKKVNFEDMQTAIADKTTLIINTMPVNEQRCLIVGTLPVEEEVHIINSYMKTNRDIRIIVYGSNSSDDSSFKKYEQIVNLGFSNIYIYCGGLFEWLLLQDTYGAESFPTTTLCTDLLKYKGRQHFNVRMLK